MVAQPLSRRNYSIIPKTGRSIDGFNSHMYFLKHVYVIGAKLIK